MNDYEYQDSRYSCQTVDDTLLSEPSLTADSFMGPWAISHAALPSTFSKKLEKCRAMIIRRSEPKNLNSS
jgi:hypothetical protein